MIEKEEGSIRGSLCKSAERKLAGYDHSSLFDVRSVIGGFSGLVHSEDE